MVPTSWHHVTVLALPFAAVVTPETGLQGTAVVGYGDAVGQVGVATIAHQHGFAFDHRIHAQPKGERVACEGRVGSRGCCLRRSSGVARVLSA